MKTSPKHYEYFKKRCLYWKNFLGLKNWEFSFEHKTTHIHHMAEAIPNTNSFAAVLCLGEEWKGMDVTEVLLDETALHEVLHVLLSRLTAFANEFFTSKIFEGPEHEIINLLTGIILKREPGTDYSKVLPVIEDKKKK